MKYKTKIGKKLSILFRNGESIKEACVNLRISQRTYKKWKKIHSEFNQQMKDGEMIAEFFWEEQIRKATTGEQTDYPIEHIVTILRERYHWK